MDITVTQHIEIRPNRAGQSRAYIVGTRVRIQDVYFLAEVQGKTPDEIVGAIPHLTLAQVHAALSYYFDHRDEILDEVRQDETAEKKLRSQLGPGPLERKQTGLEGADDATVSSG